MSVTRLGRLVVGGSVALVVGGRAVALDELVVLGAGALVIVIAAAFVVRRRRVAFEIDRAVRPLRVPAGGSATVSLRLRNTGGARSPILTLTDPIARRGAPMRDDAGDSTAVLELAPVPDGATREMSYRLPTPHRGIVSIGPLGLTHTDPFGLVTSTVRTRSSTEIIVLPRVIDLVGLPAAAGDQPEAGPLLHDVVVSANEEFAAIKEYAPGDDVRRVHWATTARLGSPMVRHYEEPWQHRTTVVLDIRRANHDPESFERAVSAAASVLELCASREELVRLVTTGGDDTGHLNVRSEIDHAVSLLAAMSPQGGGSLTGALQHLVRRSSGGTLVSVTGNLGSAESSTLDLAGSRFGAHVSVRCVEAATRTSDQPASDATTPPVVGPVSVSAVIVAFGSDDDLARSWTAALARRARPDSTRHRAASRGTR